MDLVAGMTAVAAQFADQPRKAYVDPEAALANRPCILVGPPAIEPRTFTAEQATYPIYALSSHPAGTLAAVTELAELVQIIDDVLHYERATPVRYSLTGKGDPVPAYLCTHTEIEE